MIAEAEQPTLTIVSLAVLEPERARGLAARSLALIYLRAVSACWRGDPWGREEMCPLDRYWMPDLPPVPRALPDAESPHGAGGRGIRWYESGRDIFGYVPGVRGGYRVPISAVAEVSTPMPMR